MVHWCYLLHPRDGVLEKLYENLAVGPSAMFLTRGINVERGKQSGENLMV